MNKNSNFIAWFIHAIQKKDEWITRTGRVMTMIFCCFTFFVFFSFPAYAVCNNPSGVEGQIIHNSTSNIPTYCDDNNWVAMAPKGPPAGAYGINAVTFNGSSWLRRGSALTGVSDGRSVTGSFWIKFDDPTDWQRVFSQRASATDHFVISRTDTDVLNIAIRSAGYNPQFNMYSSTAVTDGNWHHIMFSFNATTNTWHYYQDGVAYSSTYVNPGPGISNVDYDFTDSAWGLGVDPQNNWNPFMGGLADFWLDFGTYVDLSVAANREKFYLNSSAVYLGQNGELPTGSTPDLFFSGATAGWHNNRGTAGDFLVASGALTTAATLPTSTNPGPASTATQVVSSGLLGHWRMDETSGTFILDSSGNGKHGSLLGNAGYITAYGMESPVDKTIDFASSPPDNSGNRVSVANVFPTGTNPPFTVAMWVKRDGTWRSLFSGGDGIYARVNITFGIPASSSWSLASPTSMSDIWEHLVLTYNGTQLRLYVDNVLKGTANRAITVTDGTFIFGGLQGANGNGGAEFDDVRLYNRAITDDEISAIYQARSGIRYNSLQHTMEYFDGNRHVSMTPAWPEVTGGLIGHWKLEETTGNTAYDSSPTGQNGTYTNVTLSSQSMRGAIGRGVEFNVGNSARVAVSNAGAYNGLGQVTLSAWVNTSYFNPGDYQGIMAFGDYGKILMTNHATGNLMYVVDGWSTQDGSWMAGSAIPGINQWVHVAVTYDTGSTANNPIFYVNGAVVANNQIFGPTGTFTATTPTVMIGNVDYSGLRDGAGMIDDVRIYNRILGPAEIQKLYNMGSPVGQIKADPQGCPAIGDICDDRTVYVGQVGGERIFISPVNQNGNAQWKNATGTDDITTDSSSDGRINHATRQGPLANFGAMRICELLETGNPSWAFDLTDWYLPSTTELALIFNNQPEILAKTRFTIGGATSWTSREQDNNTVTVRNNGSSSFSTSKTTNTVDVVCFRRGNAPRCANPYGLEGQMTYNSTSDLVQYCDGARWIAIGKGN